MFLKGAFKNSSYLSRLQPSLKGTPVRAFGLSDVHALVQSDLEQIKHEVKKTHRDLHHQQFQD